MREARVWVVSTRRIKAKRDACNLRSISFTFSYGRSRRRVGVKRQFRPSGVRVEPSLKAQAERWRHVRRRESVHPERHAQARGGT